MTQEQRSIQYVLRYEKREGRRPSDRSRKRVGYDIKSGNRYIEVKSTPSSNLPPSVSLHNHLLRSIGKGLANYYIYLIYDMKRAPKLLIIRPEIVLKNLETHVKLYIRGKVYNKIKPITLRKRSLSQ